MTPPLALTGDFNKPSSNVGNVLCAEVQIS